MTQTKQTQQTLFGLTFPEAIDIAVHADACEGQIDRLQQAGSWDAVFKTMNLRAYVLWFSQAEVPAKLFGGDICSCSYCERKQAKLTPEKQARADALYAICTEALDADAGPEATHDLLVARLRENLKERSADA